MEVQLADGTYQFFDTFIRTTVALLEIQRSALSPPRELGSNGMSTH
jgi:hypothetical protein